MDFLAELAKLLRMLLQKFVLVESLLQVSDLVSQSSSFLLVAGLLQLLLELVELRVAMLDLLAQLLLLLAQDLDVNAD